MNIGSKIRSCGVWVHDSPFRHVTKADLKLALGKEDYDRVIAKWEASTEDSKGDRVSMEWLEAQR